MLKSDVNGLRKIFAGSHTANNASLSLCTHECKCRATQLCRHALARCLGHFFILTTVAFRPAINSQPQLFHPLKRVLVLSTSLIPGFIIPLFSQRPKVNDGHSAKQTKSSFGISLVNVKEVWLRTNLTLLFLYLSSLFCVCLWWKLSGRYQKCAFQSI